MRQLFHPFRLPLLDLLARQIFLVRRDRPGISVRVGDVSAPIAPELVPHRSHRAGLRLCACRHGAVEERVGIGDVEPERRRRATEGLWSFAVHHRVVDHDARIADAKFRMHDLAVRADSARAFFRAKRLLVPVDRLRGVVQSELRGDRVITLGDGTFRFSHCNLLRSLQTRIVV